MSCEYWTDCNVVEGGKHSGDIDVATDCTNAILQRLVRTPLDGVTRQKYTTKN